MDIKEFLQMVLPDSGEYYVLGGKKSLKTSTAKTIDGAEALIEQHKKNSENVYIGLATWQPGTDRKKNHVTGKKCFYIDIDCGPTKDYPDKKTAFLSLKDFLVASKLPAPSMIVDSGGGLHVYWVMDEVIIEKEWTAVATGLKRLAAEHKFKHDAAVVGDSARIMRVPGTFNWKDPSTPRECKVIKNTGLSYTLEDFRKLIPKTTNVVAMPGLEKFQDGGFDNIIATSSQPRYVKHIKKECKVVSHTLETGGAEDEYPAWFAMLTLLLYCEDGDAYVHPMSNKHSGYNANVVSRKWQQRQDDKAAGHAHGATTCEAFHALHPEICEACPHWQSPDRGATWSSPLYFGLPPAKDDIPAPFMRLSNGNTGIAVPNDDGTKAIEECFHGQVHKLQVFESEAGTTLFWEHHLPSKAVRTVEINATSLVDAKTFKKALLNVPLVFSDSEVKGLRIMTESWAKKIQNRRGEIKAPASYGWVKDGKRIGFRHADTVYWNDGSEQIVHTNVNESAVPIAVKGNYARWKELVGLAQQAEHIETEVLIASAFAAPLIEMTHIEGAILSAVSLKSGTGKTTGMRLGQAVWGHPKTAMFSLSDTANSILNRMGLYSNLPAMWDDIRIPDNPKEARQKVDMVYQITQGREKARMTQSAELRSIASWKTLLICTSNYGLSQYISLIDQGGTAAQHRVLEFDVSPLNPNKCCNELEFNDMEEHYGHAGIEYAKWLVKNYAAAKETLTRNIAAVSKKIGAKPEDRFTMTTIAAVFTAAEFAEKAGIIKLDKAGILKFLIGAFNQRRLEIANMGREAGAENNIVELLGVFMAEHQLNTTVMMEYPKRGRGNTDASNLIRPADRECYMSISIMDREIRILKGTLDKWLRRNSRLGGSKELLAVQGIASGRKNIGSTSSGGSQSLTCYTIEYTPETAILFGEYDVEE